MRRRMLWMRSSINRFYTYVGILKVMVVTNARL